MYCGMSCFICDCNASFNAICTGSSSTDLVLMNKFTVDKCLAGDYCDYRCINIIVSCVVTELFMSGN
jgi:hypothetical protein